LDNHWKIGIHYDDLGKKDSKENLWTERGTRGMENKKQARDTEYNSPDIVTEIKVRTLEWLGHVIRMEDSSLPKMVLNAKPEGRREVRRPRLRWLDDVKADVKVLGIKRWRIKAQDRKVWSAILRNAKVN
jgi:hypothetical protein